MTRTTELSLVGLALCAAACGADRPQPTFPPHPAGCDVTVYRGALPDDVRVDPLGQVASSCGKDDADSDCVRGLQDQVCKLGGDLVYEVPKAPERESSTMLRYVGLAGRAKR